jgi:hypothetical protein
MAIDLTPIFTTITEYLSKCVISLDNPIDFSVDNFGIKFDANLSCVSIGFILAIIFFVYFISQWTGIK